MSVSADKQSLHLFNESFRLGQHLDDLNCLEFIQLQIIPGLAALENLVVDSAPLRIQHPRLDQILMYAPRNPECLTNFFPDFNRTALAA